MVKNQKSYDQFEFDLRHQLRIAATNESINYIKKNMNNSLCFTHEIQVLFDYALPKIGKKGLILEFGVRKGKTTKEISKIVFAEGEKQKNVVLVEYPRRGAYCLGFATHPVDSNMLDKIPIFIPTSPNPSSGFLVFFTKDEIQELDISADEAFRLILSGGLAFNDPSSLSKFKF